MALAGFVVGGSLACGGLVPTGPEDPVAREDAPAAAPGDAPLVLQALSATSGAGAEAVIDGDRSTPWTPERNPELEGVLLRFEAPTATSKIVVVPCGPEPDPRTELFVDGNISPGTWAGGVMTLELQGPIRSVFVRLGEGAGSCIREIELWDETGAQRKLAPPRRVKGTVATTSVLSPEVAYRAAYLFDQRPHFAWVEGAAGDGRSEAITVTFDAPETVSALEVWNGYQRSDDHFAKNNRAAALAVSMDGGAPVVVPLADAQGPQKVQLPAPLVGRVLTIAVDGVTKGRKYDDLVISELRFVDDRGPFTLDVPELRKATEAQYGALENTPLDRVVGRVLKSRCDLEAGSFKLRPDASFVWYGANTDDLGTELRQVDDVIEGAWAVEPATGPWAKISLYARRHRVEATFRPYGGGGEEAEETTRIAGGTLEIARASELGLDGVRTAIAALRDSTASARVDCIGDDALQELVDADAVFVKGAAITDLLIGG